jgi:hypothetical protein
MTAKKFKAGDRVKIKSNLLNDDQLYGQYWFTISMHKFAIKKELLVASVTCYDCYILKDKEGNLRDYFTDEMLMLVKGGKKKKMGIFKKKQVSFKVGDKVVKARPYSKENYCRYGGCNSEVPIGTLGTIKSVNSLSEVKVKFDNNVDWSVDISELSFEKGYKGTKPPKAKPIELHVVLNDACNNFVNINNSYEEAIKEIPSSKNKFGVYKLVRVATIEHVVKVTKDNINK